ncbi:class I SAM-dependent methyltransferase [Aliidiomarina celeris]|uniref:class I SAM-dependent methyltransferase n=1 Tax=Aliidiomarina celeris TaxID=2249428 RepID=UPI00130055C6|nr:class I SAM-dependent methyltransferase [Aliidiomarina celeris]
MVLYASEPIIDAGGGASVLVDHLLAMGQRNISVLDVSGAALTASRVRLGSEASTIDWIESDIRAFSPTRQYGLWHDRAVFHFLVNAEDRQRYAKALKNALPVSGHLILASFAIGGPEKCSGLPVIQYDAEKLKAELGPGFKLLEERTEAHITPAQKIQEFAYFRFKRVNT